MLYSGSDRILHRKSFDPQHPGSILELVRDIVAMANSGGGVISVGASPTEQPGVAPADIQLLDGANVANVVNKYIAPAEVQVAQERFPLSNGRFVVHLVVAPCGKYPFLISKTGEYTFDGQTEVVFHEGDLLVRRGTRSERARHEDLVAMIDAAVQMSRSDLLGQIKQLIHQVDRLPEGTRPLVLARTSRGELAGTPGALIDLAVERHRSGERGAVLDAGTLLHCFLNRDEFELTSERLSMLIRSALRRPPTLYFWLLDVQDDKFIEEILVTSLFDEDRDKSDAKTSILELATIVASDVVLEQIVVEMARSNYKHFRDAIKKWAGRDVTRRSIIEAVTTLSISGLPATSLSTEALYDEAEELAQAMLGRKRATAESRLMTNIGRLIYLRARQGWDPAWSSVALTTPTLFSSPQD